MTERKEDKMKNGTKPRFTLDRYTEEPPVSPEEEARGALEELHAMAWKAAERIEEILRDSAVPDSRKIALAQLVLDRVYGKPQQAVEVDAKNIPQVIFVGGDRIAD